MGMNLEGPHMRDLSSDEEAKEFLGQIKQSGEMPGNAFNLYREFAGEAMKMEQEVSRFKNTFIQSQKEPSNVAQEEIRKVVRETAEFLDNLMNLSIEAHNIKERADEKYFDSGNLSENEKKLYGDIRSLNHYLIDKLVSREMAALVKPEEELLEEGKITPVKLLWKEEPNTVQKFNQLILQRKKYIDNRVYSQLEEGLKENRP